MNKDGNMRFDIYKIYIRGVQNYIKGLDFRGIWYKTFEKN